MASHFPSEMGRITGLLRVIEARKNVDKEAREIADQLARRAGEWPEKMKRLQELAAELRDGDSAAKRRQSREKLLAEFLAVKDAGDEAVAAEPQEVAPAARLGAEETVDLARFFKEISASIVDTQQALDRRSLEYVHNLDPGIAPAHFAIPAVKAEMKVGFREIGSRGVNLVLFSNKEQKEAYGESTVSFEIAAAPPPPGPVAAALPSFLVAGAARERTLDAASRLLWPDDGPPDTYQRSRDQALVLRHRAIGAGPRRYLVVWPAKWLNVTDPEVWPELKVFGLAEDDFGFDFDDVFESAADVITLATAKKLVGAAAETGDAAAAAAAAHEAARHAIDLGDALYNVVLIVAAWLEALRPPPPPPVAGPPDE